MTLPDFQQFYSQGSLIILLISLWSVVWKGLALWRASRNNQLHWFVALLVLNTVGIAEIIYIKFFQAKRTDKREWPFGLDRFFKH